MIRIFAKHPPYEDGHLGEVELDMVHHGAPTIRCVRFDGDLFALEGSHRLALAYEQGLIPKVLILEPDANWHDGMGINEYWNRKRTTLPVYTFDHVLKLEEKTFLLKDKV